MYGVFFSSDTIIYILSIVITYENAIMYTQRDTDRIGRHEKRVIPLIKNIFRLIQVQITKNMKRPQWY